MARPLRLEVPGGLYHITSRGNRREPIYLDDEDRQRFLSLVGKVCARFSWSVYAYCLMTNHYHLFLETRVANLSRGMRQLNGVYTQGFNRRHGRTGHVFEGRFKAVLVEKDRYLLAVSRYIVLNPVRAGLVVDPAAWPWSSYRAMIGTEAPPPWLHAGELLEAFGSRPESAPQRYVEFVQQGIESPGPWDQVRNQLYLGEGEIPVQAKTPAGRMQPGPEFPKTQRRPWARPLGHYRKKFRSRDEAMAKAYLSGVYNMREIADYFGVHYMTVSRAVRQFEAARRNRRLRPAPARTPGRRREVETP